MPELVWTSRFDAEVQFLYGWLEERSEGSGHRFYVGLLADLDQLTRHPWSGSRLLPTHVRRLLVMSGRYAVIHVVESRGVILHALFDQRRDPETLAAIIREIAHDLPSPPPAL